MHTRDYLRHMDWKKAIRKKKLDAAVSYPDSPMYKNLHQYSKNKIHCSCPICSAKTKRRKNDWGPGRYNYSISDSRKINRMDLDEQEYFFEKQFGNQILDPCVRITVTDKKESEC